MWARDRTIDEIGKELRSVPEEMLQPIRLVLKHPYETMTGNYLLVA
jgi:hypothetical protein